MDFEAPLTIFFMGLLCTFFWLKGRYWKSECFSAWDKLRELKKREKESNSEEKT